MKITLSLCLLLFSILGQAQSLSKWTVSCVSAQSPNDSLIITGGQPVSGFTNAPTSFIGYLPLNYSMLTIVEQDMELTVYPNPTTDFIVLSFSGASGGIYTAKIYDNQGRLMSSNFITTTGSTANYTINLGGLTFGMYLLVIEVESKVISTHQIIVEN